MFVFGDTFDGYADATKLQKWTAYTPGPVDGYIQVTAAIGARATQGLKVFSGTAGSGSDRSGMLSIVPSMPVVSGATVIFGFRYTVAGGLMAMDTGTDPTDGGAASICIVYGATVPLFWIRQLTNGLFSVYRGTTVLGTSSVGIQQGVESYLECKVLLSNTVGTVDLWLNGTNVLSLTGLDTTNGGTTWDEFRFGNLGSQGGEACILYIDEFYLLDGSGASGNARFGPCGGYATRPNAAGTNSDWTRSTGADQWATIDDTLMNGDVDYNATATINARDMLNFPPLPVNGGVIKGIQGTCEVRTEAGGPSTFQIGVRTAGTTYLGTANPVPASYGVLRECWAVSPATSAAFTEAAYNAAEFGYEKAS